MAIWGENIDMTGMRCPNCGFYNLSARSKCARCGKPLPELESGAENLFDQKLGEETGEGSGSIKEAEIVSTSSARMDTEPKEFEPELTAGGKEPPKPVPEVPSFDESKSVKELPSFDDSAVSKLSAESELGALSQFFKSVKKKVEPEVIKEPKEEINFAGEQSKQEPVSEEASLSQIEIKAEASTGSDFKPGFEEPLFPEFGASVSKAEKSETESAVSSPFEPTWGRRAMAGLIDFIIYLIISLGFIFIGKWASGLDFSSLSNWEIFRLFLIPIGIMVVLVIWFYQVFFLAVLGQTPGGMVLGIEVVDQKSMKMSLGKAWLRAILYIICLLPLGMGFLPSLWGRSWLDKIVKTKLVSWK